MGKLYGYTRCVTKKQDPEAQFQNIRDAVPSADFFIDTFTGAKSDGRKAWERMMEAVEPGDTIVFDSITRMEENAEAGVETYIRLYEKGVNLKFIKEPHIDTTVYRTAFHIYISVVGEGRIGEGIYRCLMSLAAAQIHLAYLQAETEAAELRQRAEKCIAAAKQEKRAARPKGAKIRTPKREHSEKRILELSKDFNGTLPDKDVMKILNISRHAYYNYKRSLKEAQNTALINVLEEKIAELAPELQKG